MMPLFRTTPSSSLAASIRRLMASGGSQLSPLQEMEADFAAAKTAHQRSLVDKVRAEVEAMNSAKAAREDPALAAEYAGNVAGLDVPTSTRLSNHLRGVLEQPSGADYEDNPDVQPYPTGAPNVGAPEKRLFQSALASTLANRMATGKTNASQLAQAGDRINETALTNEAARTTDTPAANRIIAAVAGKVREPFSTNAQGTVLNQETGDLSEGGRLAGEVRRLTGARAATEGAKQGELGTRSSRNTAQAGLADVRARNVGVIVPPKGQTAAQVEKWVSEVARKEWAGFDPKDRKGMNYQQHLDKVRERFKSTNAANDAAGVVKEAHEAIGRGADPAKVAKRFKEKMGFDMPQPAAPAKAGGEEDDGED